jgi:hypothetical protein
MAIWFVYFVDDGNILWLFGIPNLWIFGIPILWLFGKFCGYLVYFVVIWYILRLLGIFCGYLVYFVVIWYI